jgi:hypothetical protein
MYNADVKTVMLDTEEDFDKEYKDPMRQNNTFYGVNRRSMVLRLPKLHDRDIMTIASCNPYIDYGGITSNAYMETMESFQSLALEQIRLEHEICGHGYLCRLPTYSGLSLEEMTWETLQPKVIEWLENTDKM